MKQVKMIVSIRLEIDDSLKPDNLFADLDSLRLYQIQGDAGRITLGGGMVVRVVGYKTESVEHVGGQKPFPPNLLPLIDKYELHPDIVEEVWNGNLEFVHEDEDKRADELNRQQCCSLVFEVPRLRERKSGIYVYWHGPDPQTWALEGLRFYAERERDDDRAESVWSPDSADHPENVEAFIGWLHSELDS